MSAARVSSSALRAYLRAPGAATGPAREGNDACTVSHSFPPSCIAVFAVHQ
jgi:hypothetical protein